MREEERGSFGEKVEGGAPPRGRARPPDPAAHPGGKVKRRSDGYRYVRPQSYEVKRKAVRLYLEEGFPADLSRLQGQT